MTKLTVVGTLPQSKGNVSKSRLKHKQKVKIEKGISNNTYILDNSRTVMNLDGVRQALNTDSEGALKFFSNCREADKFHDDNGLMLVHRSAVYKEVQRRAEQPRKITKREQLLYGSSYMIDRLTNTSEQSND